MLSFSFSFSNGHAIGCLEFPKRKEIRFVTYFKSERRENETIIYEFEKDKTNDTQLTTVEKTGEMEGGLNSQRKKSKEMTRCKYDMFKKRVFF